MQRAYQYTTVMNKRLFSHSIQALLIAVTAAIGMVACAPSAPQNAQEQSPLIAFLQQYWHRDEGLNDIQLEELFNNREDSLQLLQDSLAIFTNLRGTIEGIRQEHLASSVLISYRIEIEPAQYFRLTLECQNLIAKDSLATDPIYQFVKSAANGSEVVVDGFIATSVAQNKLCGESFITDKLTTFSYPNYQFHVVDMRKDTLGISPNLLHSIKCFRASLADMWRKYRHEACDKAASDARLTRFHESREKLTEGEKQYLARYANLAASDLYRN